MHFLLLLMIFHILFNGIDLLKEASDFLVLFFIYSLNRFKIQYCRSDGYSWQNLLLMLLVEWQNILHQRPGIFLEINNRQHGMPFGFGFHPIHIVFVAYGNCHWINFEIFHNFYYVTSCNKVFNNSILLHYRELCKKTIQNKKLYSFTYILN